MKKETKILIILLIIAFLIRIFFTFSSPIRWWDETVYANLGYDLSKNPLDYSFANNGWSDWIPGSEGLYTWPRIGFRAPLLPYFLSIFYFLKIDFLIEFLIPLIGALTIFPLYFFGKKLFNKKVGIYSAIFLTFLPLHVYYSGKMLTDVFSAFLILLTFIFFWKGFEENNRKYKILFGFFLALSLLSRYTALLIMPVFLIYFLAKNKSLKFLKDKYLWYSIGTFFLALVPWFIYSYNEYKNPIGAFIHGSIASSYWGGIQPWYTFFGLGWATLSFVCVIFLFSLIYIFYKKEFLKKEIFLLLAWIIIFLGIISLMPHKEDRFILPIIPPICLLSGFFISKLNKSLKYFLLLVAVLVLSFSLYFNFQNEFKNSYTESNLCFLEGNKFLQTAENDAVVVTDESPVIYYYSKKETHFYPTSWDINSLKKLISDNYQGKKVYVFFIKSEDSDSRLADLDSNFEKVFECKNKSLIYKV